MPIMPTSGVEKPFWDHKYPQKLKFSSYELHSEQRTDNIANTDDN